MPTTDLRKINFRAVRAFHRLMSPFLEAIEVTHACDRSIDGGEWSDQWHCDLVGHEEERVANVVGDAFGMDAIKLIDDVLDADQVEYDHLSEAMTR